MFGLNELLHFLLVVRFECRCTIQRFTPCFTNRIAD
jgi:hypothetical protein